MLDGFLDSLIVLKLRVDLLADEIGPVHCPTYRAWKRHDSLRKQR